MSDLQSTLTTTTFSREQIKVFFTASKEIQSLQVTITPSVAKRLVESTDETIQRRSSISNVKFLSKQMKEGKWKVNGEALMQDEDGNLINGFHRCKAAIMANVSFETLFIKGIKSNTIHTIDTGRSRTLGDVLTMNYPDKVKYANTAAACAQFIYNFKQKQYGLASTYGSGGSAKKNKLDSTDLLKWVKNNPDIFSFVEKTMRMRSDGDKILSPKIFCGLKWLIDKKDKHSSDVFFVKLSDGIGVERDSTMFNLRKRLLQSAVKGGSRNSLTGTETVLLIVTAWNAFYEGRHMSRFLLRGTSFPEIKPI